MLCRRCRRAERCGRRSKRIPTNGSASLSLTPGVACRPNKSNTCSSRSHRRLAARVSGFQLFIKSFAIMVVQSMSAVSWDREPRLPLSYRYPQTITALLTSRINFMANLLIVDDELGMRQFLTHLFQREGHLVRVAENGRDALEQLRQQAPDLIISDIRMPDMSGVDLLREARALLPEVEVVMMTAFANVDTAREAFLLGAYDFVQKPFDNDLLKETVTRALRKISLVKEKEALLEANKALIQGQRTRGKLGNINGRSERMLALYQMIETVAQVQSTVLVTGESGTGKELVARAIHDLSPRAEKPFVSVNCGAFTETLLESELFGYVKGSFTG